MATKLTWHGHAALSLETGGYKLIVDPFLTGNPAASLSPEAVEADFILISHGHGDHVGGSTAEAQQNGAVIAFRPPLPFYTYALLAGILAAFIAQVYVGPLTEQAYAAAFNKPLFRTGSYWLILTGAAVHGDADRRDVSGADRLTAAALARRQGHARTGMHLGCHGRPQ